MSTRSASRKARAATFSSKDGAGIQEMQEDNGRHETQAMVSENQLQPVQGRLGSPAEGGEDHQEAPQGSDRKSQMNTDVQK